MSEKYQSKQKLEQPEKQPQQGAEAAPVPGTASARPKASRIGNYSTQFFDDQTDKIFAGDIESFKTKSPEFKETLMAYAMFKLHDKLEKLERELGG